MERSFLTGGPGDYLEPRDVLAILGMSALFTAGFVGAAYGCSQGCEALGLKDKTRHAPLLEEKSALEEKCEELKKEINMRYLGHGYTVQCDENGYLTLHEE